MLLLLVFIYHCLLTKSVHSNLITSLNDLKSQIQKLTQTKFERVFQEEKINEIFIELYNTGSFELVPVDPLKIAKDVSKSLAKEIHKKMKALEKSVKYTEEIARNYIMDPYIQRENVSYISSKDPSLDKSLFVHNPQFNTKIIPNTSSVHIPTEIYDGENSVLNTLKWTEQLTNVFRQNHDQLRYQYFASTTGLIIQFPGMQWRNTDVDMYDVRRRQWYVQGASSPKDVMILIDTSGSMHGRAIKLTCNAVEKLIDTMGENDYIAVAQFPGADGKKNSTPHLLKDNPNNEETRKLCFETFVQASKRNKNHLFEQIRQLKARGRAHLNEALEFAITQFHEFDIKHKSDYEGSNCNRIIVVLTDGADDYDRDRIRKLVNKSPKTKNIRIFIYSVGEDISPTDILEGITCDYRGYFGHIQSYGAVSNIIERFSIVVHHHDVHENLTTTEPEFRINIIPVDKDGFLDPKDFPPLGLGLMTSLTMPVYNRSGNVTFLGLLGTDMTVDSMKNLVPESKLGPNGYGFAINTNGFIIFHPELRAQKGWMPDPPNVDLVEIEFLSDDSTNIRNQIIDCASSNGSKSNQGDVTSLIKVRDGIHTYETKRTFAFTGVPYSSFGITIVNPSSNKFYAKFNEKAIELLQSNPCLSPTECYVVIKLPNLKSKKISFDQESLIYAEPGLLDRCQIKIQLPLPTTINMTPSLPVTRPDSFISLTSATSTSSSSSSSSSSIYNRNITIDRLVASRPVTTSPINNFTNPLLKNRMSLELMSLMKQIESKESKCTPQISKQLIIDLYVLDSLSKMFTNINKDATISSVAIAMMSGVTMVYPQSSKSFYADLFDSPWTSSLFQRTFDNPNQIIFYSKIVKKELRDLAELNNETTSPEDVMVFKSFFATPFTNRNIPVAVLGFSIKQTDFSKILHAHQICHNESRICFILEDAGYVISVSDDSLTHQIGRFYGDVDPFLMEQLLNNSVFARVTEYDYQASCPRNTSQTTSATTSLFKQIVPLSKLPLQIMKLILIGLEKMAQFIKIILHFLLFQQTIAQEATATNNKNISCIKKGYRYYLSNTFDNQVEISLNCSNSFVSVFIGRIKDTNSIIVSYDQAYEKDCFRDNLQKLPREPIYDSGPDICKQSKSPRYRQRPENKCYSFDPNENFMRCSACRIRNNERQILLLSVIFFVKFIFE